MRSIDISGGTIGNDTEHLIGGNVFGGCMGPYLEFAGGSSANAIWPSLARCKVTGVTVRGTALVKGSVYGGGKAGTVRDITNVTISGGTVNYSVYGGGLGLSDLTYANDSTTALGVNMVTAYLAGRVYGNTKVLVSSGVVKGSVYGGGDLASVGMSNKATTGLAEVTVNGNAVIGTAGGNNGFVYGGCKGLANVSFAHYANVNETKVIIDAEAHAYLSFSDASGSFRIAATCRLCSRRSKNSTS